MTTRGRTAARGMIRSALIGGALAGMALSAGCAGQGAEPAPAAARPRPLAAAEQALLHRATEKLIAACMDRRGFSYWAAPDAAAAPGYVLDDVATARRQGYRTAALPTNAELARDPNLRYVRGLPADRQRRYSSALNGSMSANRHIQVRLESGGVVGRGTDGCVAEAEQALYGDLAAWTAATVHSDEFAARIPPLVARDPRYRRAQDAWAGCMRAAGLPYRTPEEIRRTLGEPTRANRAAETRLAVAEARCARQTRFGAVATAVDREYREAIGPADRAAVDAHRRLQLAALPRARTALAG